MGDFQSQKGFAWSYFFERFILVMIISHIDQIDEIREQWDEVYGVLGSRSPLLSLDYVKLWYKSFSGPDKVRIYQIRHDNETIGFLPLYIERKKGFRVLSGLSYVHLPYCLALVKVGFEERFQRESLYAIREDEGSWDMFRYRFTYSCDPLPGLFTEELLVESGMRWHRTTEPTYIVHMKGSFSDYLGTLSLKVSRILDIRENVSQGSDHTD
ncbi:MAG TPA: hypothetical protein ENH01_05565 [Nitrospirae bacterium]|nr:hypothetical protein [Nitrospirota bacterium]